MKRLAIPPGLLLLALALSLHAQNLDRQLQSALHRETIAGDLAAAIALYQSVVTEAIAPAQRPLAARALFQIAQCQEKLGQRKDARATYTRLVREFAGEPLAVQARARLAGWVDAAPGPRNLAFEEGTPGHAPPGWFTPALSPPVAELRRDGCHSGRGCAVLLGNAQSPAVLMQSFSAVSYRGRTLRLRAAFRGDAATAASPSVTLWLRIDRGSGQPGNADSADIRPPSSSWTTAEVTTEVDADAQFLEFGVRSTGEASLWVDGIAFEVAPKAEIDAARDAVAVLYLGLDAALEQGPADTFPALAPGALFRVYGRQTSLAETLKATRYSTHQTAIGAFRLSGAGAVATVRGEFTPASPDTPAGMATWRDSWIRIRDGWRLRERTFLTGHYRARRTDSQSAKLVAADLKELAAPLALVDAGHNFYDLAPFGAAVAGAPIAVLGAAAEGTHEGQRLRHRLTEYLVKEKGFRTIALAANGLDGGAVDRYIQTGEPAIRDTLARWPGAAEELYDAIEWMRVFNRSAAAGRAPLHFAALPVCAEPEAATVAAPRTCPESMLGDALAESAAARKIVLWAGNFDIAPLRRRFGDRLYGVGFALQRGELRASGFAAGAPSGVTRFAIPRFPEGFGDAVLGSAGMPLFFLDLRSVPGLTTLGLWLAEPHPFLTARSAWNRDDPENHLHPVVLARLYDGLIFVAEAHAAQQLEASPPPGNTH